MKTVGRLAASLLIGIAAAVAAAVLAALALAVVDLYQAGHNLVQLSRPWIETAAIRMSRADALMLGFALFGGLAVAVLSYRGMADRDRRRGDRG